MTDKEWILNKLVTYGRGGFTVPIVTSSYEAECIHRLSATGYLAYFINERGLYYQVTQLGINFLKENGNELISTTDNQ